MARGITLSATLVACGFFSCGPAELSNLAKNYTVHFHSAKDSDEILAISTSFSLSCPTVYNGSGSFSQSQLPIVGTSGSIQVVQSVDCSLTIQTFNDGTSTYSPVSSPLVISISAAGAISSSGSLANPPVYTASGTKLYLFLASSTSSSLTFVYAYDPAEQSFLYVPLLD